MPEEELKNKEESEAFENLAGFFDLAFRIAIREKIDIGQFDDNKENYD